MSTWIFTVVVAFLNPAAMANTKDMSQALLTSFQGTVEILTPTQDRNETVSKVLFEGQRFAIKKARIGLKIVAGEVLRTGSDGKAKAIYQNGDVILVGPSSAIAIPKNTKTGSGKEMGVTYGRVRALIDKEGPLSGLKIKTPTAVAGIRGTDLIVGYNPGSGEADVHVLRGKVEVKSIVEKISLKDQKTLEVNAGQKAEVRAQPTAATAEEKVKAEVKTSSKQDLVEIQKETSIAKSEAPVPEKEKKVIQELEQKATESVIKDIRKTDPKTADQLLAKGPITVEQINTNVVMDLYKNAPKAKGKPKMDELEESDEDVYKKYFQPFAR